MNMFLYGIFRLIFPGYGRPWLTETLERYFQLRMGRVYGRLLCRDDTFWSCCEQLHSFSQPSTSDQAANHHLTLLWSRAMDPLDREHTELRSLIF